MLMQTCRWCGKRYDVHKTRGVQESYNYCSAKCYNAAKHERQRKQREAEESWENLKRKKQEIKNRGGLGAKLVMIWDIVKWSAIIAVVIWFVIKYFQLKQ